jgi:hypothetical protein
MGQAEFRADSPGCDYSAALKRPWIKSCGNKLISERIYL